MEAVRVPWEEAKEKIEQATHELEEKLRGLEAPIFEGILQYLIHHYTHPEKCTLREMERELGVPYTRLKRFVDRLKKESILIETDVGTAKVLTLCDLERAIQLGYLSFTLDRLRSWSWLPHIRRPEPDNGFLVRARAWLGVLFSRVTGRPATNRAADFTVNSCDTVLSCASYRLLKLRDGWAEQRTKSIESWNEGVRRYWSQYVPSDGHDEGISELLFDEELEGRIVEELRGLEDIVRTAGYEPLHVLPFTHSVLGLRVAGQAKPLFSKAILARDIWFEMDCPEECSLEEGRQAAVRVSEKQLKYLMVVIRETYELIEREGVEGALTSLNQPVNVGGTLRPVQPYTRANLLYHVLPLTYAALVVLGMGGDIDLFRQGKRMAQVLRAAVEQGYRGKEAEDVGLEEWFERQQASSAAGAGAAG